MNAITNGVLLAVPDALQNIRNNGILGGQNNLVTNNYGSIIGGLNNQVSGAYSAILGGSGNNDGGLPWTGIFGCNIAANTIDKAFWVNELVVPNMPDQSVVAGLPTGALYYCVTTNVVYRKP